MATTLIQAKEVINGGVVRPAPSDVRFDAMLLSPHIQDAEARFVKPILTSAFYNTLIAEKGTTESNYNAALGSTAAAFTTTSAYEDLWTKHLRDYCAVAVLYEAMPFIAVQAGSNGLYLNDNEYGRNAGVEGTKFLQDTLMTKIRVKEKELKSFLCTCAASLPGFNTSAVDYCPSGSCRSTDTSIEKSIGIILY